MTHQLWIPRLGWTLLHFLWQGAVLATAYAVVRSFFTSPRVRHALACTAMAAMIAAPPITFFSDETGQVSSRALWTLPGRLFPVIVAVWFAGVLVFSLRLIGTLRFANRLRSTSQPASPEWQRLLDRMATCTRPVRLLISSHVNVPTVIGWLRPAILMPVAFLTNLPAEQITALLAHELAHIRRNDYLISLLQNLAEALLFYHPAVWWISGQIRAEREMCCDDLTVAAGVDVLVYARALADLESRQLPLPAANGGSLVLRIRRLIEPQPSDLNRLPSAAAAWTLMFLWIAGAGVATVHGAQVAPPPSFQPLPIAATPAILYDPIFVTQTVEPPPAPKPAELKPWQKWLTEDVAYIITDEERRAFKALSTDEQREVFVEQFWLRRDPTPDTVENEYKEEHYRRIAYVNEHYASAIPGWKTDRGRIYITYGPPDEIDAHPSGGSYQRSPAQGGGTTSTYPFEDWRYRHVDGIGNGVNIEFVDTTMSGEYHMTMDPSEKEYDRINQFAKLQAPPPLRNPDLEPAIGARTTYNILPMYVLVDYVRATDSSVLTLITVQFPGAGASKVNLLGRISTMTRRPVTTFERSIDQAIDQATVPLAPNRYRLNIVAKDNDNGTMNNYEVALDVPNYDDQKLETSSLILADEIERLPLTGDHDMFAIGDMKVRPRIGNSFSGDERMGVYLQVYNFGVDDRTQKPAGSIEYRIAKGDTNVEDFTEDLAAIPNASASQVTIEKMMPLSGLDQGSYVLTVIATDRVRNQSVQRQQLFRIN